MLQHEGTARSQPQVLKKILFHEKILSLSK